MSWSMGIINTSSFEEKISYSNSHEDLKNVETKRKRKKEENPEEDYEPENKIPKPKKPSHHKSVLKENWDKRFQELVQYKEVNGHTNVPFSDKSLGRWLHGQRHVW